MRQHRFSLVMIFMLLLSTVGGVMSTATAQTPTASGIAWSPCATAELPTRECGEFDVPLDYDEPDGPTISLAVARVPATNQEARIGTLFLNPGGPGGSGVLALPMQYLALQPAVQERFDVFGFDPRGAGNSAPVRCFDSIEEQTAFQWQYMAEWVAPANPADEAAATAAFEDLAQNCGERNADILPHVSTANVAGDLDLLRQAVGDEQINYLGTSYGTYLGQTYANLFPDRIRAMVIDGTINPPSYTSFDHGDGEIVGPDTTSFLRILSPEASTLALEEFFVHCATAGPELCAFAASTADETRAKFDTLMAQLQANPIVVTGPAGTLTITYSFVTFLVWNMLYGTPMWPIVAEALQQLAIGNPAGFFAAVPTSLGSTLPTEYINTFEAQWAINCVDTDNPSDPAQYQPIAQSAAERSPYFGPLWLYQSVPCAFWPAEDDDRYEGPWDAETSATILILSRVFDPATPHGGAIAAEQTLANARLLTINGWGHGFNTAGRSTCADDAMTAYLIDGTLPPVGTECGVDEQPFGN
ncbi:MAG TPA: alpha/beta hydrolase [Thermomicrobiales bacterium]|nr:alpha/beta hydrolase [Thermomicrobiales bacterium]